jgi:hypothetical protein
MNKIPIIPNRLGARRMNKKGILNQNISNQLEINFGHLFYFGTTAILICNAFTYNDLTYKDFTYNDFTYIEFTYNDFT